MPLPGDFKSTYPTHRDTPNHPGDSRPDPNTIDSIKPTPATHHPTDTDSTPETSHKNFGVPGSPEV